MTEITLQSRRAEDFRKGFGDTECKEDSAEICFFIFVDLREQNASKRFASS